MSDALIYCLDDDEAFLSALKLLLLSDGWRVKAYSDPHRLLAEFDAAVQSGVVLLDMDMPQMGGLQVQEALQGRGSRLPVVFITGRASVGSAVAAMRNGAVHVLEKPFDETALLQLVARLVHVQAEQLATTQRALEIRERWQKLSEREQQILTSMTEGFSNKEIAAHYGISHRTVEAHRARLLLKLGAETTVEAVRFYLELLPYLATEQGGGAVAC